MAKQTVTDPRVRARLASLRGESDALNVTHASDVANILADVTNDVSKTVGAFSTSIMLLAVVLDFMRAFNKRIHTSPAYSVVKLSSQFALGLLAILALLGIFLLPIILLPIQMAGNAVALFRRSAAFGRSAVGASSDEALLKQKLEKLNVLLASGHVDSNRDAKFKKTELLLDCYVLLESMMSTNASNKEALTRLKAQLEGQDASLKNVSVSDQAALLLALKKHQRRKRNWAVFQMTMQLATLVGCGLMFAFPYVGAAIVLLSAMVALLAVFIHHRKAISYVFTSLFSMVAADFNRGMKSMLQSFVQLARGRKKTLLTETKPDQAVSPPPSRVKQERSPSVPPPTQTSLNPPDSPPLKSVVTADKSLRPRSGSAPPALGAPHSSEGSSPKQHH